MKEVRFACLVGYNAVVQVVLVLWVEVRDGGWDDGSAGGESGREGEKKGLALHSPPAQLVSFTAYKANVQDR